MSGSHRITPTAQYLSACVLELRFPYDAQLVGSLKSEIPPEYRRYDPERRIWTVDSPFRSTLETAISLLRRTYPSAKVIGDPETQPITKTPPPDPDYGALHLLPTAPPSLVRAAHRTLALEHHPDKGGDHELMVAVNLAYEHLQNRGCA